MKRVLSYPLEAGGSVLIEVDDDSGGGVTRGLRPDELAEKIGGSFEAALATVGPAALAVVSKVRNLADAPEGVEVEFGLKFGGQAGAFIASASTEAQFRIKMVWKRESAK